MDRPPSTVRCFVSAVSGRGVLTFCWDERLGLPSITYLPGLNSDFLGFKEMSRLLHYIDAKFDPHPVEFPYFKKRALAHFTGVVLLSDRGYAAGVWVLCFFWGTFSSWLLNENFCCCVLI